MLERQCSQTDSHPLLCSLSPSQSTHLGNGAGKGEAGYSTVSASASLALTKAGPAQSWREGATPQEQMYRILRWAGSHKQALEHQKLESGPLAMDPVEANWPQNSVIIFRPR